MTQTQLQQPDEVVTHVRSQDVQLPGDAGTFVLLTLDNGFDHTKPNSFGPAGLAELSAASYVVVTAGVYDLLVEVVCADDHELLNLVDTIRATPGRRQPWCWMSAAAPTAPRAPCSTAGRACGSCG